MTDAHSELSIRRYAADDHDAVWALHNRALDGAGAHLGNGAWDDDLHSIETVYLTGGGEFLVGTLVEQIVGMGALRRTGPHDALLTRMRIAPHLQGNGLGTQMLQALETRARELGITHLHLDTTTGQRAAQALYRRHGFQITGTGREGPFEVIFYDKELG